ncbi:MAG: hypothetical protein IPG45_26595 [Deltaproteobacteria bacterium]|jgi:uncharacterized membrane protein|nr:hypothetical protein [Deltaproteobacteria bacterium]
MRVGFVPALALAGFLAACGGDEGSDLGECPPSSMTQQVAGRTVVTQRCSSCHSSTLTGAARQNAPVGVDYDTLAGIRANTTKGYEQASAGTMPPTGALSATDLENLRIYLACGAPDVQ